MISSQNKLLALLSQNKVCFDCTAKSPTCVNMTVGSFVCMQCAGYLREFGHRIKSVTTSKFSPEEVEDLSQRGNENAAKTWLAVWIETEDPKPSRENTKKIKEFMKKKYILKSFYWDGSSARAEEPEKSLVTSDWSNLENGRADEDSFIFTPYEAKAVNKTASVIPKNTDNMLPISGEKKVDNSWADFASAFPSSKKSFHSNVGQNSTSVQEILVPNNTSPMNPGQKINAIKETLLIPLNIKKDLPQDSQLDPFESCKSASPRKYDAFKDLAGLSLSDSTPILSSSTKKFTNTSLDLSKYVEGSGTDHSWKKTETSAPVHQDKAVTSLSQFEMNPFAFDHAPIEKSDSMENTNNPDKSLNDSAEIDGWNHNSNPGSNHSGFDTNWGHDSIPLPSNAPCKTDHSLPNWNSSADIMENNHAEPSNWNSENDAQFYEHDSTIQMETKADSYWHSENEVKNIQSFEKESSVSTLVEGTNQINDIRNESEKYQWEQNYQPQAYVPYELDSNVWS